MPKRCQATENLTQILLKSEFVCVRSRRRGQVFGVTKTASIVRGLKRQRTPQKVIKAQKDADAQNSEIRKISFLSTIAFYTAKNTNL